MAVLLLYGTCLVEFSSVSAWQSWVVLHHLMIHGINNHICKIPFFFQRWMGRLSIQHMKKTCCLLHFRNKSSTVLIIQRLALRLGSLMSWGMTEGIYFKWWTLARWHTSSFVLIRKYMWDGWRDCTLHNRHCIWQEEMGRVGKHR